MTATEGPLAPGVETVRIAVCAIRRDGDTQLRTALNPDAVSEYAALMQEGVVFPPVRVWWDGSSYWLTDGFHRVAAAERAGLTEIIATVHHGNLCDARWDSYGANGVHGLRLTSAERHQVLALALQHPNAAFLGNLEIAKHLHLPESTVRRWRKKRSSTRDEDTLRMVTRGGTRYMIETAKIGKGGTKQRAKSRAELKRELSVMKGSGSPLVQPLLNIVGNWAFSGAAPSACLEAIERIAQHWSTSRSTPLDLSAAVGGKRARNSS